MQCMQRNKGANNLPIQISYNHFEKLKAMLIPEAALKDTHELRIKMNCIPNGISVGLGIGIFGS